MQVHRDISRLPVFRNAIITIGTFDGVHKGHQVIIDAMKKKAAEKQGETVLITFDPHPRKIVQPDRSLQLINSLDEKIGLLSKHGIDHLVIVPFTKDFAALSADAYIEEFLVKLFHPAVIIIGYDHHFGNNREGNFSLLEKKKNVFGYELVEIPRHVVEKIGVSSTQIRNSLLSGNIENVNTLLGYSFFFKGTVIQGDKIGRTLGYPTANIEYKDEDKIRLAEGVYAVEVIVDKKRYRGMLSIGKRPTLNDTIERVEVNIFDFDEDIYGQLITVVVKYFLRQQEKYNSLDELRTQLAKDKENSLRLLS